MRLHQQRIEILRKACLIRAHPARNVMSESSSSDTNTVTRGGTVDLTLAGWPSDCG